MLTSCGRLNVRGNAAVLVIGGLAQFASANAAMGLALEMFDYAYWWPYVVATVILEAWMIGRGLGDGWPKALGISLIANLITAVCCPQLCAVGMHQAFVGSPSNPDPFLNALCLFVWFGLISALIESVIWKLRRREPSDWVIVRKSLLAHAAGVPLALAILLIPDRPYQGLEATTRFERNMTLHSALDAYVKGAENDPKGLPAMSDAAELLRQYGTGRWAAAYIPDFHRFDFGEAKRIPYEWNQRASGLLVGGDFEGDGVPPPLWLLRAKVNGNYLGFKVDTRTGSIYTFSGKSAAELEADTDALIRMDAEIRKYPQTDSSSNDSK